MSHLVFQTRVQQHFVSTRQQCRVHIYFSWIKSINKAVGRNIALGDCMNHLYTNIAALYRAFCQNLYGPLAFLAVKIKYSLYWNFKFPVNVKGGKESERRGGTMKGWIFSKMLRLSVLWHYHNGSLSVLFLCLAASIPLWFMDHFYYCYNAPWPFLPLHQSECCPAASNWP